MSQRLRDAFALGKSEGRTLFLPYVTAGYPRRQDTVPLLLALEAAGSDVVELGVPFTDPLADGATIQHANQVAVEQDVTLEECLGMVAEARKSGLKAPVLLMGYYNPIASLGEARCCELAAAAGVDGFIVVDLPPEEAERLLAACKAHDLSMVPLVAPTTSDARMAILAGVADAFLYCVSVTGTTGSRNALPAELPDFLGRIRKVTTLPLAVGFGVSTRDHVVEVGRIAEAAIVGSAIIAAIDGGEPDSCVERVRRFVEDVTGRRPGQAT
jgi:tryptophan synthase